MNIFHSKFFRFFAQVLIDFFIIIWDVTAVKKNKQVQKELVMIIISQT